MQLTDYFISYAHLLEGKVKILGCLTKRIYKFNDGYCNQIINWIVMGIYTISVPAVLIIEYGLEESGDLQVNNFHFSVVTRLYVVIITLLAVVYWISHAMNFRKILPFAPFPQHMVCVILIQGSFNITGAIIRFTQKHVGSYTDFESYQLLFVCVYSALFAVLTLFPTILISPEALARNETTKSLQVPERTETHEALDEDNEQNRTSNRDLENASNRTAIGLKVLDLLTIL